MTKKFLTRAIIMAAIQIVLSNWPANAENSACDGIQLATSMIFCWQQGTESTGDHSYIVQDIIVRYRQNRVDVLKAIYVDCQRDTKSLVGTVVDRSQARDWANKCDDSDFMRATKHTIGCYPPTGGGVANIGAPPTWREAHLAGVNVCVAP
jgi:hypothetical protein